MSRNGLKFFTWGVRELWRLKGGRRRASECVSVVVLQFKVTVRTRVDGHIVSHVMISARSRSRDKKQFQFGTGIILLNGSDINIYSYEY